MYNSALYTRFNIKIKSNEGIFLYMNPPADAFGFTVMSITLYTYKYSFRTINYFLFYFLISSSCVITFHIVFASIPCAIFTYLSVSHRPTFQYTHAMQSVSSNFRFIFTHYIFNV